MKSKSTRAERVLASVLDSNPAAKGAQRRLQLEKLVDELIKSNPNPALLREQMLAAGLKYSDDTILSMNAVLRALEETKPVVPDAFEDEIEGASKSVAGRNSKTIPSTQENSKAPKRRQRDNVQDL